MGKVHFTPKKARFCEEFMVDMNATQAAVRAGYSQRSAKYIGAELLAQPAVAARIAELRAAVQVRTDVTIDQVVAELWRNAMTAQKREDFKSSNRALELLGKHLGMFPDKLTVDFRDVANLSDEEIAERRAKLKLVA